MAVSHLFSGPDPYSKKGLHNLYEFIGCLTIMLKNPMKLHGFERDAYNPYESTVNHEGDEPV